jgi:hypothetical protein
MKLYTICKSCKEEIKIASTASTRPELEMEKGGEFNVNCTSCGVMQKKRVNDIRAKHNIIMVLIGLLIGIVASIALLIILGDIKIGLVLVAIIPLFIWQQQSKTAQAFNSYRIRR